MDLYLILLSLFYVGADANGVVTHVMDNDEPWGPEGTIEYTWHLDCYHQHHFPGDEWTYTYDLRCIEFKNEGKSSKLLTIDYDNNVFDKFNVTSCELKDIVKSVFPPEKKNPYEKDEIDDRGRPIFSYLKYITVDGKCYVRKYSYQNRVATAAKRYTPEEIKCEGDPDWERHGKVAHLTHCRVPELPLSHIVKDWSRNRKTWTIEDYTTQGRDRLLECTYDQFSELYDLTCTKTDKENEFYVFVEYGGRVMERFIASSCKEEEIIKSIFAIKETTKYGKGPGWSPRTLWFAGPDNKCYKRVYGYCWFCGGTDDPKTVDCPKFDDEWTNPSFGFSGVWSKCTGSMSLAARNVQPQKPPQHPAGEIDHKQETHVVQQNHVVIPPKDEAQHVNA